MKFFTTKALVAVALLSSSLNLDVEAAKERLQACIEPVEGSNVLADGKILVAFSKSDDITMSYNFKMANLESLVTGEIKLHAGLSCKDKTALGDSYYKPGLSDPWGIQNANYTSNALQKAQGKFIINNGYGHVANYGHALVVYSASGEPVGCGVLNTYVGPCQLKACIHPFPTPNQPTSDGVFGKVSVKVDSEDLVSTFQYKYGRLPPKQKNAQTFISNGTNCNVADQVLVPYWNDTALGGNPWPAVGKYSSNKKGNANGHIYINTGFHLDETLGRTVVLYDKEGAPLGCGVLVYSLFITDCDIGVIKPTKPPTPVVPPSVNDPISKPSKLRACIDTFPGVISPVRGKVILSFNRNLPIVTFAYHWLRNLDPFHTGGFYIAAETTCDSAVTPYYSTASDPWSGSQTVATYTTTEKGSVIKDDFSINYGYGWDDTLNHAVVVTAANGTTLGCGLLVAEKATCYGQT